ncbi:MAG: TetR/AcrR family transcriptional regulator [Bacteroidales bacterium]|nr:TetR/AcrR family transcriptional regulator [Bacteroidales bacterium]
MAPRTSKQFEEMRESKRKLIMESALKLFASHGFFDTSVNMISKDAGISKGLMYNYFKSKEELLRSVVLQGINKFLVLFDPDHDGVLTKTELKFFIEETFRTIETDISFWKIYISVLSQPQVLKIVGEKFWEIINPVYKILENYFEKNRFKNPKIETKFFGALMDGICINYILDPDNFPLEEIKKKVIELYI